MPKASLGARLHTARVETTDYGLRELAKLLSISPTHLSDIENDRRVPSEELLRSLAKHLRLDFDDLMVQAGKVYEVTEKYVENVPQAVTLFRKVSESKLSPEELGKLEKKVEQLARDREKKSK